MAATDAGWQVVRRSMMLAGLQDGLARPVHLLWALSEVPGPVGQTLTLSDGRPLVAVSNLESLTGPSSAMSGYLHAEVQDAANVFAASRGEALAPAHLLLAVIDHAESEVIGQLGQVGLDAGAVRSAALAILAAPADLPPIAERDLTPAGLHGRPPLPVEDLDPRAWRVLRWRQEHLPLDKLRHRHDWYALSSLERRAAAKIADQCNLEDGQRYSLSAMHREQVQRLAAPRSR